MARSVELKFLYLEGDMLDIDEYDTFKSDGTITDGMCTFDKESNSYIVNEPFYIDIDWFNISSDGTKKEPLYIYVIIDGQKDNASFSISAFNDYWFNYEIERYNGDEPYVRIKIKIDKNLSTITRYGGLTVSHKSSTETAGLSFSQEPCQYMIEEETNEITEDKKWIFKSVPENTYEEKEIIIKAIGGSEKWYVKEIQQYQTLYDDTFKDQESEIPTENDKISQLRVPYDDAFNYRIEDNKLIIRSYGQIDLITKEMIDNKGNKYTPHMRYFFVLSHSDVNNSNKQNLDNNNVVYEIKKMFIFDGIDNMNEYKQ